MVDGNNDCFFDTTNRILEVEHMPFTSDINGLNKAYNEINYDGTIAKDSWGT